MPQRTPWVLLAYRLPRDPSTPRSSLWRKLRRLGAAQVLDGLAALPLDARNREQLEWLADEVLDAGGTATIWVAEPASAAQERALARSLQETVAAQYRKVIAESRASATEAGAGNRRTLGRLRRELGRAKTGPQAWGSGRPGGQDEPAVAGPGPPDAIGPEGTVCSEPRAGERPMAGRGCRFYDAGYGQGSG